MGENTDKVKDLMTATGSDVSLNVGLDEVVNVYVARYENQLFDEKERLSNEIKMLKRSQTDLNKKVVEGFNQTPFNTTNPILNLTTTVEEVKVCWDGTDSDYSIRNRKNNPTHFIQVNVKYQVGDFDTHQVNYVFSVDEQLIREYEGLKSELEQANSNLAVVMENIKSVSRKERQIRGKISEIKLEQSGYAELVNEPELLKLIQL